MSSLKDCILVRLVGIMNMELLFSSLSILVIYKTNITPPCINTISIKLRRMLIREIIFSKLKQKQYLNCCKTITSIIFARFCDIIYYYLIRNMSRMYLLEAFLKRVRMTKDSLKK